MIKTLLELQYRKINEFKNQNHLQNFVKNCPQLPGCVYYCKILEQKIRYDMDDGSSFYNSITLLCYFYIDEQTKTMHDAFSVLSYPVQFRAEQDMEVLNNLYSIFRSDLKKIYEIDRSEITLYA